MSDGSYVLPSEAQSKPVEPGSLPKSPALTRNGGRSSRGGGELDYP